MKVLTKALILLLTACLLLTGCDTPSNTEATPTTGATTGNPTSTNPGATDPVTSEPTSTQPGSSEPTSTEATASPTNTPGATNTPTPTSTPKANPYPFKVEDINSVEYAFGLTQMVQPFWYGNVAYNESICLIQRADGSITGDLLFTPTRIISIYDNALKKQYVEGKDYTWEPGTKTIKWKKGSSIPYFTQNDIEGKDENGTPIPAYPNWDSLQRSRFGNALYCVAAFLYEKQIAVTYTYDEKEWKGPVPTYKGNLLPKTMEKLKKYKDSGDDFMLYFFGDSIFTGCDSSAMYNRDPRTPIFPKLVQNTLKEEYGVNIKLRNPSVGGMTSQWGKENADKEVASKNPDLVIIGFGMNSDASLTGKANADNIKAIIDTVKAKNPDCEFIVMTCMVPNKTAGFLTTQNQFPAAYKALEKEGVAVIDLYSIHDEILKTKDFIATSGNNINHPNDWLARIYAMSILSTLIDYTAK